MSKEQSEATHAFQSNKGHGGHLYMQTNETQKAIIHYLWSADGTITEAERILTSGSGFRGSARSIRSAGRTISRARVASSSRQIGGSC